MPHQPATNASASTGTVAWLFRSTPRRRRRQAAALLPMPGISRGRTVDNGSRTRLSPEPALEPENGRSTVSRHRSARSGLDAEAICIAPTSFRASPTGVQPRCAHTRSACLTTDVFPDRIDRFSDLFYNSAASVIIMNESSFTSQFPTFV